MNEYTYTPHQYRRLVDLVSTKYGIDLDMIYLFHIPLLLRVANKVAPAIRLASDREAYFALHNPNRSGKEIEKLLQEHRLQTLPPIYVRYMGNNPVNVCAYNRADKSMPPEYRITSDLEEYFFEDTLKLLEK